MNTSSQRERGGRFRAAAAMAATLVLLAGCMSPAARIRRHPELFNSFPPEVQEKVRRGEVDVGFDKNMVRLALGDPDHVYARTMEKAKAEVWCYSGYAYRTDMYPMGGWCWYRDRGGSLHRYYDCAWVDVDYRSEYDALRVEFHDDKVAAIEQARR